MFDIVSTAEIESLIVGQKRANGFRTGNMNLYDYTGLGVTELYSIAEANVGVENEESVVSRELEDVRSLPRPSQQSHCNFIVSDIVASEVFSE